MARSGISYEEVAAAAEKLSAGGTTPSHRAIRAELGTGSANTIHRHLTQWFAQRQSRVAPATSELPADLARTITAALGAAAAAAKSASAEELARATQAADVLADEGTKLEAELEVLRGQLRDATSEADGLRGRCAQQAMEIERAGAELAQERAARAQERAEAERARTEAALLKAAAAEHLAELERLRAHAREIEQAAALTQRELAVAEAARRHLEERLREHQEYEQMAGRELTEQRARVAEVLERERDALTLAAKREGELRSELAHSQGKLLLLEAKLQWQRDSTPDNTSGKKGQPK